MKKIILLFLLLNFGAFGQTIENSKINTFISRKGLYQIKYDTESWYLDPAKTLWDAQFQDKYNLLTAYFMEFDYFFSEKKLKSTLKSQYDKLGKITNFKIYNKTINNLSGNYFECELKFNDFLYKYQGFIYNGKGGTVELQFGLQSESLIHVQPLIDDFCNNFTLKQ